MDFSIFREGLAIFEKELENRNSPFFGGRFLDNDKTGIYMDLRTEAFNQNCYLHAYLE